MAAKWPTAVAADADLYVAVNSLQTTLSTAVNASVTSVVLASSTGFPTAGAVTIDNEVIFYTGISGATLTGCTRGADGTTAAAHSAGVPVGASIVAFHHNGLMAEIEAIETYLSANLGTGATPLTASRALASNSSSKIVSTSVTDTELGYLSGVTSALQTQMDLKAPKASPSFSGTATFSGNISGVDFLAGSSGTAGSLQVFPSTATKGKIILQAADNAGNTNTIITNASFGQATTLTIPDPASSAAKVILSKAATFEGNVAMGSNKLTGLSAGSANGDSIRYEQNFMRQAPVYASSTTVSSTASTTYVDTSLTATITPTSASSRILVLVSGVLASNGSSNGAQVSATVADGSGNNLLGARGFCTTDVCEAVGNFQGLVGASASFIHSPATTSAFTYTVRIQKVSGTTTATWGNSTCTQQMILIEVI